MMPFLKKDPIQLTEVQVVLLFVNAIHIGFPPRWIESEWISKWISKGISTDVFRSSAFADQVEREVCAFDF